MPQYFTALISLNHYNKGHKNLEKVKNAKKSIFWFERDGRPWNQFIFLDFSSWEFYSLEGKWMPCHWFLVITVCLIKILTDRHCLSYFVSFILNTSKHYRDEACLGFFLMSNVLWTIPVCSHLESLTLKYWELKLSCKRRVRVCGEVFSWWTIATNVR